MTGGFVGSARLVRLAARRDRFTLPAWILGIASFVTATTALFDHEYAHHPALLATDTQVVIVNPGMRVLGLATGTSVGSYTLHRDSLTMVVLAALMSILAVVRHTRQAEELGREELLAAGVVGRYASLTAGVVVAVTANVALAVATAVGMVLTGQPVAGSLVGGTSIALVGVVFAGVAAVTCQLASTTRGAIGLASAVLGGSFLLAGLGNMLGTVDVTAFRVTSAWPAWLSPIGWSQQMRPFADDAWWPLGLAVLTLVVCFWVAAALVGRRDVGRGILPERRGAARAAPALLSPAGLVWRLQRGTLLGWTIGMVGFGLIFGALSKEVVGRHGAAATKWYAAFGGAVDLLGAYWASMMQIAGMTVAGYVVALVLRLRQDEAQGTLEPVLAGAVSRTRWLAAYAVNALAGAVVLMLGFALAMAITGGQAVGGTWSLVGDLVGAALVQLPAIGLLGAAAALAVMVLPHWATGLSWAMVAGSVVVGPMFGPSLGLPVWLQDLSPFTHVPNAPAEGVTAGPVLALVVVCAFLAVGAVLVLRRRNLALPA